MEPALYRLHVVGPTADWPQGQVFGASAGVGVPAGAVVLAGAGVTSAALQSFAEGSALQSTAGFLGFAFATLVFGGILISFSKAAELSVAEADCASAGLAPFFSFFGFFFSFPLSPCVAF